MPFSWNFIGTNPSIENDTEKVRDNEINYVETKQFRAVFNRLMTYPHPASGQRKTFIQIKLTKPIPEIDHLKFQVLSCFRLLK